MLNFGAGIILKMEIIGDMKQIMKTTGLLQSEELHNVSLTYIVIKLLARFLKVCPHYSDYIVLESRLEPGDFFGRALLYGYELSLSFPPQTLYVVFL